MPQDWEPTDWEEEQAKRVAEEIIRLRGRRSTQWLADRTKELGSAVSRSVIADLENGRRRYVTTAELMMLARALNTTPMALLYPDPLRDDSIEMLPGVKGSRTAGLQWFSGEAETPSPALCDDAAQYRANLKPLADARRIPELEKQKSKLAKLFTESSKPSEHRFAAWMIADIQDDIDKLKGRTDGG